MTLQRKGNLIMQGVLPSPNLVEWVCIVATQACQKHLKATEGLVVC